MLKLKLQYFGHLMRRVDSLEKTLMLKKLEIEPPYDPAIPLLGIHTEETRRERDTCTPMFITALFIIARTPGRRRRTSGNGALAAKPLSRVVSAGPKLFWAPGSANLALWAVGRAGMGTWSGLIRDLAHPGPGPSQSG